MGNVTKQTLRGTLPPEVQELVDHHPAQILTHFSQYEDKPYAQEALQKAFESAAHIDTDAVRGNSLLEDKPYKEAVLRTTYTTIAEKEPESLIFNNRWLEGKSYKDDLLKKAAYNSIERGRSDAVLYEAYDGTFSPKEDYKEDLLNRAWQAAATQHPDAVAELSKFLKGRADGEGILQKSLEYAATHAPEVLLHNIDLVKDKPYGQKLLAEAIDHSIELAPGALTEVMRKHPELVKGNARIADAVHSVFERAATQNPEDALNNISVIQDQPYRNDIIAKAFNRSMENQGKDGAADLRYNPNLIFKHGELLQGLPDADGFVQKAAGHVLMNGNPSYIIENAQFLKKFSNAETILDLATTSRLGANETLRDINDLHESPDKVRFAVLKNLSARQDYNLLVTGGEEAYTSTYNGLLNDMLGKLKQNHQALTDVLGPAQQDHMAVFLSQASSYNRLQDVLQTIPHDKLPGVVHGMVEKTAQSGDLSYATSVADLMTTMKGNNEIRVLLEHEIKNHYQHPSSIQDNGASKERDLFGLLASAYGANGKDLTPENKAFFVGMAHNDRYALPDMSHINQSQLVDGKGVNNQLMIFADDKDSKDSFIHWKNTYKDKAGWKTQDKGSFIQIESTGGKVPVRIYANKPDHHDDGIAAIKQDVAARQGSETPSFQTFIGRGHSYHAPEYLKQVTPDMKLIALGSCGGYSNMSSVLQTSPNAQITATQGRGTMYVNDPMLFHINESINKTGQVQWKEQQTYLDALPSDDKRNYLLPNRDVPLMMIKKFNDLQKDDAPLKEKTTGMTRPQAPEGKFDVKDMAGIDYNQLKTTIGGINLPAGKQVGIS